MDTGTGSYGFSEQSVMASGELSFLDDHFMALGAMGITVVASSGDDGVFNFAGDVVADGSASVCTLPAPSYPAVSPYVTAVGATQILATHSSGSPTVAEVGCSLSTGARITSGMDTLCFHVWSKLAILWMIGGP